MASSSSVVLPPPKIQFAEDGELDRISSQRLAIRNSRDRSLSASRVHSRRSGEKLEAGPTPISRVGSGGGELVDGDFRHRQVS